MHEDRHELTTEEQIDRLLEKERELFEHYQVLAQAALRQAGLYPLLAELTAMESEGIVFNVIGMRTFLAQTYTEMAQTPCWR